MEENKPATEASADVSVTQSEAKLIADILLNVPMTGNAQTLPKEIQKMVRLAAKFQGAFQKQPHPEEGN